MMVCLKQILVSQVKTSTFMHMQCTDYCQLILYFPDIEIEKIVMAESARSGVAPVYSHDYYKYRRHMETVEKDKEEVRHRKTLSCYF